MKTSERRYSKTDQLCMGLDQALRAITGKITATERPYPAANIVEPELTKAEQKISACLMRVNHAGEVSAQALYHGQGIVSRNQDIQLQMQEAAREEGDHLAWCSQRLTELGSHTSYLNPVWYAGSFIIGMTAGVIGDKWSLGFVAETERQVIKHLEEHLDKLPEKDIKSARVLEQMRVDEDKHRVDALAAGGVELPVVVKKIMEMVSKVMVWGAYWI